MHLSIVSNKKNIELNESQHHQGFILKALATKTNDMTNKTDWFCGDLILLGLFRQTLDASFSYIINPPT